MVCVFPCIHRPFAKLPFAFPFAFVEATVSTHVTSSVHCHHQAVIMNSTQTSLMIREFIVLTFLRQPMQEQIPDLRFCRKRLDSARTQGLLLFQCLKFDHVQCEVCAMLRLCDCHHCFEPTLLALATRERCDIRKEISQLAFQFWAICHRHRFKQ